MFEPKDKQRYNKQNNYSEKTARVKFLEYVLKVDENEPNELEKRRAAKS